MTTPSHVVIWSADVDEPTLDRVLVPDLPLRLIKLDRLGLTRMGLPKIRAVQDLGFNVFADAKIAEIPDKVIEIAKLHLEYRPWMLNVMAGVCSSSLVSNDDPKKVDALKRFADACIAVDTKPCAVTVLTSKSDDMVLDEFNGRTPIEQVLYYAELLLNMGFTDMVCSPLEALAIRAEPRFDQMDLNCPGIRLPGSSSDDQARTDTPYGAIAAGVNRVVIGRDLTNGNLDENFARVAANLNPQEQP